MHFKNVSEKCMIKCILHISFFLITGFLRICFFKLCDFFKKRHFHVQKSHILITPFQDFTFTGLDFLSFLLFLRFDYLTI